MQLRRGELPFEFPVSDGTMPESLRDVDMAYHVPFDWGVLQVSEEAYEGSGLMPLALTEKGPAPTIDTGPGKRQVLVSIVDLSQAGLLSDALVVPHGAAPIVTNGVAKKGLFEITVGIAKKEPIVNGMIELVKTSLSSDQPWSVEEDEIPAGPEGQSYREFLENDFPHMYSHIVARTINTDLSSLVGEYDIAVASNNHVSRNRGVARFALALSAGFAIGTFATSGNAELATAVALGEFAATTYTINKGDAKFLRTQAQRETAIRHIAGVFANRVATSVHDIYCVHSFEENILGRPDAPTVD